MGQRTAFVTGGTGFVGLNLVEQLVADDWSVTALHRRGSDVSRLRKFPVTLVEGAIEDPASLARAVPANMDAIFHVAGDTSMWRGDRKRLLRTNVDGTRNMANEALAKGCGKFVHTSTSGVFGLPETTFDETSAKLGKGSFYYQHSKALAEEEIADAVAKGLDAVIMNPANIIGRYDWNSWSRFIQKVAHRQMPLIPPGRACYCDVEAVVRAHVSSVDNGQSGHNYLLGGDTASYPEVAALVSKLLDKQTHGRIGGARTFRFAGTMMDRVSILTRREPMMTAETAHFLSANIVCKSDKAARELGYQPASIEAMFKSCIDWMIAEGRL
jgi:dihydroflavonol-4-reductase